MASTPNAMEYSEHERTFGRFIRMVKVGSINCAGIVLVLALVGFGGGTGKALGGLMTLALLAAAAIDLGRGSETPKASIAAFVLTGLLALIFI
jgi:hypothetical protein